MQGVAQERGNILFVFSYTVNCGKTETVYRFVDFVVRCAASDPNMCAPKTRNKELGLARRSFREENALLILYQYRKLAKKTPIYLFMDFVVRCSASDPRAVAFAKDPKAGAGARKVQFQRGREGCSVFRIP